MLGRGELCGSASSPFKGWGLPKPRAPQRCTNMLSVRHPRGLLLHCPPGCGVPRKIALPAVPLVTRLCLWPRSLVFPQHLWNCGRLTCMLAKGVKSEPSQLLTDFSLIQLLLVFFKHHHGRLTDTRPDFITVSWCSICHYLSSSSFSSDLYLYPVRSYPKAIRKVSLVLTRSRCCGLMLNIPILNIGSSIF